MRFFSLGVALIANSSRWTGVGSHPLCFYNDKPTDYEQVVTFCPQPVEGACCNDAEEAAVEALFLSAGPLSTACADFHKQVCP